MSNITLVTSFHPKGYQEYGRRFLQGFIKHFPKEITLYCFYEGEKPEEMASNVIYFDLNDDQELTEWDAKHANNPQAQGVVTDQASGKQYINYRFQATKFFRKIAALTSPKLPSTDWRIWIDADIIVKKDIPLDFFTQRLDPQYLGFYIGREPDVWHHSECGFVAYNMQDAPGKTFLQDFRRAYLSDQVFGLPEWHDSFVYDVLRLEYQKQGFKFFNIAAGIKDMHPWPHTDLGPYMEHLKGPVAKQMNTDTQTQAGPTNVMPLLKTCKNRYQQLGVLTEVFKPHHIVEVGTNAGNTAVELIRVALKHHDTVHYTGFDLFEDITDEISAIELNAKPTFSVNQVRQKLDSIKNDHPGFTYDLVKGDTKETIPNYKFKTEVDLVFLDGGHSVETIKSDFISLVERSKLIILDDYYIKGVDTEKFGCNKVLGGFRHVVLPVQDTYGEKTIALAGVGALIDHQPISPPIQGVGGQPGQSNVNIKTRNCVEDEIIQGNVRAAYTFTADGKAKRLAELKAIQDEIELLSSTTDVEFLPVACEPTRETIVLVGGAPSIWDETHPDYESNWKRLNRLQEQGKKIVVVKTSHDHVINKGITPWGCFLLDPRDHVAKSIQTPNKDVVYFISSMCDKEAWTKFTACGAKVYGYHAGVNAGESDVVKELWENGNIIHGGTTSGFRGMNVLYQMGYRNFELIGLDSSYAEKPEETHGRSPKEAIQVTVGGKKFWTDPELIAQSQDAEMFLKMHPNVKVKVNGDSGMIKHVVDMIEEHFAQNPGERTNIQETVVPYLNAFQTGDIHTEACYIENALLALQKRKKKTDESLSKLPTLDDLINTV